MSTAHIGADRSERYLPRWWQRTKYVTSSAMALALAFSLTPASASWAQDSGEAPETSEVSVPDAEVPEASSDEDVEEAATTPEEPSQGSSSPTLTSSELGLGLHVRIASDGTPDWDADDAAGNDSGPNNGIVRVNDTVTYEVEYVVASGEAENLTWSMTFPKGMELTDIPGYCQAGSTLVPETAGEPSLPLSADSINELEEQTLTCNMGTRAAATDKVFVSAKVLNLAHQGMDLPIEAASVTADGVDDPVVAGELPSVKASARLMWDLSKNGVALAENTGYTYGPAVVSCYWDSSELCLRTDYSVLLSSKAGGKGAMPAIGDITFVDDLSPESMYPQLDDDQLAAMNADLETYGSRVMLSSRIYEQPGSRISGSLTSVNAVRDSGTLSIDQEGPGKPAKITISNADTTLRTYPTEMVNPIGKALPSDEAYAVSFLLRVFTPVKTIRDFGSGSGSEKSLRTYNEYEQLAIHGFTVEDVQYSADQPGPDSSTVDGVNWNDYRVTTPRIPGPGGIRKTFVGVPGNPDNMPVQEFDPANTNVGADGPPGGVGVGN